MVVTGGPAGRVLVDGDDARRASSYRVSISDTASTPMELVSEIVQESEHTFSGWPSGTLISVTVWARNHSGGESAPSAPGSGTVP